MSQSPEVNNSRNRLGKEKSPYLLQHADNPVAWYPWGEEAFAKAKAEDKPIFLSIGYSTCHWCHVMAHESFEDPETAQLMNKYFVSIKVDREERPDLDNIYMKSVMALTGQGGWPLSVFLTPDKKPFFGGTYFPPHSQWGMPGFKEVLTSIHSAWTNQKDEITKSSQNLTMALQGEMASQKNNVRAPDKETLKAAYLLFTRSYDDVYGGFGRSPKFPTSHNLSFLLRYYKRANESQALVMVEKTLTEMAKGGMYDHLGGGFHRYSTDQQWHVPHFEKMLYDQATLAKTYLEAYQETGKEFYAQTAREIFDYVLRGMQSPEGGFYCAEDADSLDTMDDGRETMDDRRRTRDDTSHALHPSPPIKKEGAFYVWPQKEILEILGPKEGGIFNYHFGVEPNGNAQNDPHGEFTGKNILYAAYSLEETAEHFRKSKEEVAAILQKSREKLFIIRGQRPKPHLDDKILVDWNGLMISSLAFGSRVLDEPRYGQAAERAAQFIFKKLKRPDGRLLHRYRDGEAAILATMDDYAFLILGLIDLYEATFQAEYLKEAKRLTEEMIRLFWDENRGGFFFAAADAEALIVRRKEIYDGAIPSGNAVAALDLIRLGRMTFNRDWETKAQKLLETFSNEISSMPTGYTQSLMALDFGLGPSKEIVLAGDKDDPKLNQMIQNSFKHFIPNKVVLFRPVSNQEAQEIISLAPFLEKQTALNGQATAYVCENYVCRFPTTELEKFNELLIGE